jgi:hypothetical protein
MESWIKQNADEITETAEFNLKMINNTINILQKNVELPFFNSDNLEQLYNFNFFAVIRENLLNDDSTPKDGLTKNEFTFLIQSFLHTFQPLNYLNFVNILLSFKNNFTLSGEYKLIYQKGITRCIDFFYTKFNDFMRQKDMMN